MACFATVTLRDFKRTLSTLALSALLGCGAELSQDEAARLRGELRAAIQAPVTSRDERDRHSRLLESAVDRGALSGLDQDELRAALGPGVACNHRLCAEHGFNAGDWYYEIGQNQSPKLKQLPVLIVGFDPRRRVARVWTLKTD